MLLKLLREDFNSTQGYLLFRENIVSV